MELQISIMPRRNPGGAFFASGQRRHPHSRKRHGKARNGKSSRACFSGSQKEGSPPRTRGTVRRSYKPAFWAAL